MAIRAIKTTGGGTVSGSAVVAGGGTSPLAPNLDSTWLSGVGTWVLAIHHQKLGQDTVTFGYQGTITPPTGTDTSHLKQIHITRINAAGDRLEVATLAGPFPADVGRPFKTPNVDTDPSGASLEFACENEDSVITPNPFTVAVTGAPTGVPTESFITGQEILPRHQTPNRGLVITLGFIPIIDNAVYPCNVTFWTTRPARSGESGPKTEWRKSHVLTGPGLYTIGAPGTDQEFDIWPPTVQDEQWTVTFALGNVNDGDSIPSSARTSTPFVVRAPAAPAPTAASSAYIDQVLIGTGNKRGKFGWGQMFADLPFDDPEFVTARWTVQNGHITAGTFIGGGQHDGQEVNFTDLDGPSVYRLPGTNTVVIQNPLLWDVPDYVLPDGSINPNNVFRIKLYVESRNDANGTGGTFTQQTAWSSGVGISTPGTVDHQDIVLDLNGSRPLGANLATTSSGGNAHKIPTVVVPIGADGTLSVDALGDIHVNQPALVISNLSGNLTISRISDINNIVVANLQGNLDISRITNVGTIAIGSLSGNLDVSRVQNITTLNIESFSGTMSISKIRDLSSFSVSNFTGNLDVTRINNITLLFISQFQGTLDISRVTNVNTLFISNFQGNLDISRVQNVFALAIGNFQGNLSASRIDNLTSISIGSFSGNIDITRVNNISQINIGTLSGVLNVSLQIVDGSIPINKIATLFVNNIQGWDGGFINVGGSGLRFSGFGGIQIVGGGNIVVNPGYVDTALGYKVFFSTVIDGSRNAFFSNITMSGGTLQTPGGSGLTTGAIEVSPGKFLNFYNGVLIAKTGL